MTIKEKLQLDKTGLLAHGPINIVILGDINLKTGNLMYGSTAYSGKTIRRTARLKWICSGK